MAETSAQNIAFDEDRILGAVFGCALGDALGLPAEGCLKWILAERYPNGLALPHRAAVRDFPLNDWSDDTDMTVLLVRSLAAYCRGETPSPERDFAGRLADWLARGFPEHGDTQVSGCGGVMWRVITRPEFRANPFAAAAAIAGARAGNGALMRTAPCAFTDAPEKWAAFFCRVTHVDPRCVATCVAQALLVRSAATLAPGAVADAAALMDALAKAGEYLAPQGRDELNDWVRRAGQLGDLSLDERDARSFTLKTFGCAVWAFYALMRAATRDAAWFCRLMSELALEGGDADTNGAVAGAILGASMGYRALPADWLAVLPHRAWLEQEVRAWLTAGPA